MKRIVRLAVRVLVSLALSQLTPFAHAQDLQSDLSTLVREFDAAQYGTAPNETKAQALEAVRKHAVQLQKQYPNRAEPLCWHGWALMSKSVVVQDMSSLDMTQQALSLLEAAVALDPAVYNGVPYASLGDLNVLGSLFPFPIRYGGKEKGRTLYRKALEMNPSSLSTNLRYANFLFNEKDFVGALKHATAASKAPPLTGREAADKSLRVQAERLIDQASAKLR